MAALDNDRLVVRVVYTGPPLAGKTQSVRALMPLLRGKGAEQAVVSPGEWHGRTAFFDWADYEGGAYEGKKIRCQILSTPGQVALSGRRESLLRAADAVILVIDSQEDTLERATQSYEEMAPWLAEAGRDVPIRVILQCNKQDLPNAIPPEELSRTLRLPFGEDVYATSAATGKGLRAAFVGGVRNAVERARALVAKGIVLGRPDASSGQDLFERMQLEAAPFGSPPPEPPTPAPSKSTSKVVPSKASPFAASAARAARPPAAAAHLSNAAAGAPSAASASARPSTAPSRSGLFPAATAPVRRSEPAGGAASSAATPRAGAAPRSGRPAPTSASASARAPTKASASASEGSAGASVARPKPGEPAPAASAKAAERARNLRRAGVAAGPPRNAAARPAPGGAPPKGAGRGTAAVALAPARVTLPASARRDPEPASSARRAVVPASSAASPRESLAREPEVQQPPRVDARAPHATPAPGGARPAVMPASAHFEVLAAASASSGSKLENTSNGTPRVMPGVAASSTAPAAHRSPSASGTPVAPSPSAASRTTVEPSARARPPVVPSREWLERLRAGSGAGAARATELPGPPPRTGTEGAAPAVAEPAPGSTARPLENEPLAARPAVMPASAWRSSSRGEEATPRAGKPEPREEKREPPPRVVDPSVFGLETSAFVDEPGESFGIPEAPAELQALLQPSAEPASAGTEPEGDAAAIEHLDTVRTSSLAARSEQRNAPAPSGSPEPRLPGQERRPRAVWRRAVWRSLENQLSAGASALEDARGRWLGELAPGWFARTLRTVPDERAARRAFAEQVLRERQLAAHLSRPRCCVLTEEAGAFWVWQVACRVPTLATILRPRLAANEPPGAMADALLDAALGYEDVRQRFVAARVPLPLSPHALTFQDGRVVYSGLMPDPGAVFAEPAGNGYAAFQDALRKMWPDALVGGGLVLAELESKAGGRVPELLLGVIREVVGQR